MSAEKIAPCPYCGGDNARLGSCIWANYITCDDSGCKALGPESETPVGAVVAWNRVSSLVRLGKMALERETERVAIVGVPK